jgi:hypothetical protein
MSNIVSYSSHEDARNQGRHNLLGWGYLEIDTNLFFGRYYSADKEMSSFHLCDEPEEEKGEPTFPGGGYGIRSGNVRKYEVLRCEVCGETWPLDLWGKAEMALKIRNFNE